MLRKGELLRATAVGTAMFGVCWVPTNANAQSVPGTGWTGVHISAFGGFNFAARIVNLSLPARDDAFNYTFEGGVPRPVGMNYTGIYQDAVAIRAPNPWPTTFNLRDVGWGAGGAIGYDYDFGGAVLGLVGDYTYFGGPGGRATWNDTYHQMVFYEDPDSSGSAPPPPPDDVTRVTEVNVGAGVGDLMTLRARVGAGTDRVFFYGTGGLAYGRVWIESTATLVEQYYDAGKDDLYDTNINWAGANSQRKFGFVVGGGTEIRVAPRLNLMFEGLYYNLGRISATATGTGQVVIDGDTANPTAVTVQPYTIEALMHGAAFRVGITLRP
jgi:opacity protein-like surface antigen